MPFEKYANIDRALFIFYFYFYSVQIYNLNIARHKLIERFFFIYSKLVKVLLLLFRSFLKFLLLKYLTSKYVMWF